MILNRVRGAPCPSPCLNSSGLVLQFMPLLAVSDAYFKSIFSRYHLDTLVFDKAAAKLISVQHLTFLPLLMVAKFGEWVDWMWLVC